MTIAIKNRGMKSTKPSSVCPKGPGGFGTRLADPARPSSSDAALNRGRQTLDGGVVDLAGTEGHQHSGWRATVQYHAHPVARRWTA